MGVCRAEFFTAIYFLIPVHNYGMVHILSMQINFIIIFFLYCNCIIKNIQLKMIVEQLKHVLFRTNSGTLFIFLKILKYTIMIESTIQGGFKVASSQVAKIN